MGKKVKSSKTPERTLKESPRASPRKISRYEIQSKLGRGGMGVVYLARDPGLDRKVAIKTLAPLLDEDKAVDEDKRIKRFIREARAIAKLAHPNIVTVHHVGKVDSSYFIVMEYVEGKTLSWIIKSQKALSIEVKLKIMKQICRGLQKIHELGLVHRDIKPSNIMIKNDGVIKIMDFGIVHTPDSELTQTDQTMGTPNYMAPEQLLGDPVDQRTDIFSLSALFYELFTGKKAFPGDTTSAIVFKIMYKNPPLPSKFNPILSHSALDGPILKALSKKPVDRYASCMDFLADVESALTKDTVPTEDKKDKEKGTKVIIFHSPSIIAMLQNPFDMPIEIEIDGSFSASLKRKHYVETRLDPGEHRIALRHREKLMKGVKYTTDENFTVQSDAIYIETTTKLGATDFRILDKLPAFFKKEYKIIEIEH